MVQDFNQVDSKGSSYGVPALDVYVYPNELRDEYITDNEIIPAITDMLDQLYGFDAISSYRIYRHTEQSDVNYIEAEEDGGTYYDNFRDYVNRNNYDDLLGIHLGVTSSTRYANAEYVGKGDSAFVSATRAFVGVRGDYAITTENIQRYQNAAIQESLHNSIVSEYQDLAYLAENDEHQLGMIRSDGKSTPMLVFYEEAGANPIGRSPEAQKGYCQSDTTWSHEHTRGMTFCSKEAVKITGDNDYNA